MNHGTNPVILAILIILSTGCGTSEAYVIESEPSGANVSLSNGLSCITPCSLNVKRRGHFVATISRDGYETVTANVSSSIDSGGGWGMAGNVLLGGIIGAGVDAGTGAMHSHQPNPLQVKLIPESESSD